MKLPFSSSTSSTLMPFNIIRCDLWTSPILSSMCHCYYLVVLDDYTNYLWPFPMSKKSQVYSSFLQFRAHMHPHSI